ncbi:hypothetical protein BKN38_01615 [Helicobacter sp. CLO-3]|uniref:HipA domain-containing protein n=1 Tax=unclassified Helicobacter TaxID=2593540 RepID=UPI000804FFD9|nr:MULTISPECIES: HipA domain-containing protein [unclassified Helicobacter]OBV29618.1 hypothetical protein BA723_04885 [Helicobacter sp. CLO-3]OHU85252.1 hypothetical protein BKN38_01615 [Helicobacter sp. CLO-3]
MTNPLYIFKQNKLYAKIDEGHYYLFCDDDFALSDDDIFEIIDILPEGIDLEIMLHALRAEKSRDILPFLINTIGDFHFSFSKDDKKAQKPILSSTNLCDLDSSHAFPNILKCHIDIPENALIPSIYGFDIKRYQRLSISGYQHKLQVGIINNIMRQDYADFILKPASQDWINLAVNEHLHTSFMREFGFEVPFNAIIYDENLKKYHYIIKRFDIDSNANKLPQISLNALSKSYDKYSGSIENLAKILKNNLNDSEKMQFVKFIYANALLHNSDLHKRNISFVPIQNKLALSPIYDIINTYPIRGLSNEQCVLFVKGKRNNIKISHFKDIARILCLDFDEVRQNLAQILEIYAQKYPQYIEKIKETPSFYNSKEFRQKLKESYDKCLRINALK